MPSSVPVSVENFATDLFRYILWCAGSSVKGWLKACMLLNYCCRFCWGRTRLLSRRFWGTARLEQGGPDTWSLALSMINIFLAGRQGHPDRFGVLGNCVRPRQVARCLHQHLQLQGLDRRHNELMRELKTRSKAGFILKKWLWFPLGLVTVD